jgi:hypothetical protein
MNDKDKEAFEAWWKEYTSNLSDTPTEWDIHDAWQAACEYKQNELSVIMEIDNNHKLKIHYLNADNEIKKLQSENKKLREALIECPIVGEIHRDSNERFKEWNLIHRNTLRELKVGE